MVKYLFPLFQTNSYRSEWLWLYEKNFPIFENIPATCSIWAHCHFFQVCSVFPPYFSSLIRHSDLVAQKLILFAALVCLIVIFENFEGFFRHSYLCTRSLGKVEVNIPRLKIIVNKADVRLVRLNAAVKRRGAGVRRFSDWLWAGYHRHDSLYPSQRIWSGELRFSICFLFYSSSFLTKSE